jgi:DNA-directed RNA polymerase I subunit RPA2
MERDALIAHGTSFLLQDRLMNCSDYSTAWICRTCGSLISLGYDGGAPSAEHLRSSGPGGEYCRICRNSSDEENAQSQSSSGQNLNHVHRDITVALSPEHVLSGQTKGGNLDVVAVPFVFRYLCAELASMGIAVSLEVR